MKKGFVDISVLLDRSGSMDKVRMDTIGGFNSFIEEQKKDEVNDIRLSLYQFDDNYQVDYENQSIKIAPALSEKTFVPHGWTALYDAIGKTMKSMGERYSKMSEEDRPEKVIFVVITDGEENSSTEYSFDDVKTMIEHQQSKYNWKVIFLGSELKTVNQAKSMGVSSGNTLNYKNNSRGISAMYKSMSRGITGMAAFDMNSENGSELYSKMNAFEASDQEEQDKI